MQAHLRSSHHRRCLRHFAIPDFYSSANTSLYRYLRYLPLI